jgi:hypothetical protein
MSEFLPIKSRRALPLIPLIALVISGPLLDAQGVQPLVTFVVNDTADLVDMNLADETCEAAPPTPSETKRCTLRAAIQQANARGGNAYTILLPPGTYTLALRNPPSAKPGTDPPEENSALTGDLDITGRVTIVGAGPNQTIVDGNNVDRVFDVGSAATATLMGITIRGGCVGPPREKRECFSGASWEGGGGIRNSGSLSLVNTHVRENQIISAKGGAGILSSGTSEQSRSRLTIAHSVVAGNVAGEASSGGGIANDWGEAIISETEIFANAAADYGGGIQNGSQSAALVITDSLIRKNEANRGGGVSSSGTATLTNVTLSENKARFCEGAAVYNYNAGGTTLTSSTVSGSTYGPCGPGYQPAALYLFSPLTLRNTIVNEPHGCAMGSQGSMQSQGYNLDRKDTCNLRASGDLINTDPKLEQLKANGGPTATHRLSDGSAARDKIPGNGNDSLATDQRGAARPFGPGFDIGAFEGPHPAGLAPSIMKLEPDSVPYPTRQADLRLRVIGTDFKAGMGVMLGGMRRPAGNEVLETSEILPTTYVSETELSADLEPRHTVRSGMLWVRVVDEAGVSSSNLMRLYVYQRRLVVVSPHPNGW